MTLIPGRRTTDHRFVGWRFRVQRSDPELVGECVSVTPWGSGQIRWIRLRFADGSEKSFAPSHVWVVE